METLINKIDRRFRISDGRKRYGTRVSFDDASKAAVHRWYVYKEGFSPELLALVLDDFKIPNDALLLDPFAGVGTSVLSATALAPGRLRRAIGIEYNPFATFVAKTKLAWNDVSPSRLRKLAGKAAAYRARRAMKPPPSATLRNPDIYPTRRLNDLFEIRAGIDAQKSGVYRRALRLALASVLEAASYAKKDGRALRIIAKDKRTTPARKLFLQAVERMATDIEALRRQRLRPARLPVDVARGDARELKGIRANSVGLALYSPPYLNGIDYSEVYKVEEWFLGFVKSVQDLYDLRRGTLRSHASIRSFKETEGALREISAHSDVRRLLTALTAFFEKHERRSFQSQYAWLIPAYFEDMYQALKEQLRVLEPGGYAVCVVANSMFSDHIVTVGRDCVEQRRERWRIPLPTDAIIAELGRAAGFNVASGIAARSLRPRNVKAAWSRETLVVLRKPVA